MLVAVVFETNMVSVFDLQLNKTVGKEQIIASALAWVITFPYGRRIKFVGVFRQFLSTSNHPPSFNCRNIMLAFLLCLFLFKTSRILFIYFWLLYQIFIAISFDY